MNQCKKQLCNQIPVAEGLCQKHFDAFQNIQTHKLLAYGTSFKIGRLSEVLSWKKAFFALLIQTGIKNQPRITHEGLDDAEADFVEDITYAKNFDTGDIIFKHKNFKTEFVDTQDFINTIHHLESKIIDLEGRLKEHLQLTTHLQEELDITKVSLDRSKQIEKDLAKFSKDISDRNDEFVKLVIRYEKVIDELVS